MSTPTDPRKEHASTYFVQDRSSQDEMDRLQLQDKMLTAGMGGLLPEQPDPTLFQRVLDVGCGTGNWLIEVAKAYPATKILIGVDISSKMIKYAREQAELQQVDQRVEFHVMDALRMLEFPNNFFDLVNQRLGMSYLRTFDWPKLLQEYQRVAKSDAIIRITEASTSIESDSPALTKLCALFYEAGDRSGRHFGPESNGVVAVLGSLMERYGLLDVQTREYKLVYRAGTVDGQSFYEDMAYIYRVAVPFLQKWAHVPANYNEIYQQALKEMQQPDFVATWIHLTAWGKRSSKRQHTYSNDPIR